MRHNAIEYWYPKIKDIVPTPRTIIVPAERKWDKTGNYLYVPKKYVEEIIKQADNFSFPIFLRASDSSIKHSWKDTCFVKCKEDLKRHINMIANECESLDVFGGVPLSSFAIREYIEMDSKFKYFYGELPINPELRYFIYNHKVICHHPYWTYESIKKQEYWKLLDEMNTQTKEEKLLLNKYACEIATAFDDYWSIDFCRAKSGKWYCIDMAIGEQSWHPECNLKLKELK